MKLNLLSLFFVAAVGLGIACGGGDGKAKNTADSYFKDMEKKAAGGDPVSQMIVGKMCNTGDGTKQDKIQALKWLLISSRSDNNPAKADAARDAAEVELDLKPEESAQARAAADSFKPTP